LFGYEYLSFELFVKIVTRSLSDYFVIVNSWVAQSDNL